MPEQKELIERYRDVKEQIFAVGEYEFLVHVSIGKDDELKTGVYYDRRPDTVPFGVHTLAAASMIENLIEESGMTKEAAMEMLTEMVGNKYYRQRAGTQ